MAARATLHCLTGCAIGEVLGMVIGTSVGLHDAATVALAADTISIAVMEIIDNAIMVMVPGAMESGITAVLFWASLAFSLAVAFVLTTPINRWLMSRGKGHAVVHAYY